MEKLLGVLGESDAGGGPRDDDSSLLQGCALGEEADDLLDREDEVARQVEGIVNMSKSLERKSGGSKTHVNGLSCKTLPFFNPLNLSCPTSGMASRATRTGPIGQAPSKPLE